MTQKDRGLKRLLNSFRYAFNGLISTYKTEQSVWIYLVVTFIVIVLGFLLKIEIYEWIIIILILGIILALEIVNTSIESVVNLATTKYHPLAKKAKDTSAAAVMVFAFAAVIIGLIIFLPKVIALFKGVN